MDGVDYQDGMVAEGDGLGRGKLGFQARHVSAGWGSRSHGSGISFEGGSLVDEVTGIWAAWPVRREIPESQNPRNGAKVNRLVV